MACCENERGSPLAHKSVQAWSRKFFNRNWKESLVSRDQESRCFQSRSRGKHQDSRENRTNQFPEGPYIKCLIV